jgi:uncharacterized surface protein with fasciclin (FAS1) repeats
MFTHIKNYSTVVLVMALLSLVASCNKIPEVEDIKVTTPTGKTIADVITDDPQYSLLKLAATKAGVMPLLSNPAANLTLLAPNNTGFGYAGINDAVINALPAEQLASILSYHVIAQKLPLAAIPSTFPNTEMPTLLQLPGAPPIVKMNIFLQSGTPSFANNIPFNDVPEVIASNGVIHQVFTVVMPPSKVMLESIASDTTLTYLVAAITRADLGLPEGSKFSQLLANPLTNFTVFAPVNDAFRATFPLLGLPSTDISMIQFIPVKTLIGLLAYHVHVLDALPPSNITFSRAFSGNLPKTPTPINTFLKLVNYPNPTPPLIVDGTKGVKGYVNPTYTHILKADFNAVNGVYHKIDGILLPFLP